MTTAPLISIIIPAYNCARFLEQTLNGILAQTLTAWECVIIDDGSGDETAAIAKRFTCEDSRFRVFAQPNGGPSVARNHGFQVSNAASRYVTFMDSDDVWLPHALQTLLEEIERHPDAIGAHGLGEYIDAQGNVVNPGEYAERGRQRMGFDGKNFRLWDLAQPTSFAVLSQGNVLFPPGLVLARRSAYDKAGSFDESFKGPEDWDMLIRLSRHGDLRFVNEVILLYRRHDSNLGAVAGIEREAWRVRCKAFFSPENSPEQQRIARGGWRAYQIYMIQQRLSQAKSHLNKRDYKQSIGMVARVPVHCYRYVQGHPTMPK